MLSVNLNANTPNERFLVQNLSSVALSTPKQYHHQDPLQLTLISDEKMPN